MPTPRTALLALALALAPLASTWAQGAKRALPGVNLSEVVTFKNRETPSRKVMPFGEDFFLATTQSRRAARGSFYELEGLRLYRYTSALSSAGEVTVAWPDEAREHLGIVAVGERFIWTFATLQPGGKIRVAAEVLDARGRSTAVHRLVDLEMQEYAASRTYEAFSDDRDHYVRVFAERSRNRLLSKRDEERATLAIAVFDTTGAALSNDRKRLRVNRDQLDIMSVAVDDAGRAYVLAKVLGNSSGRERVRESDATVMLYTLAPGSEEIVERELAIEGQFIEGISLVPGADGAAPTVVGIYAERRGREPAGFFAEANVGPETTLRPQAFTPEMLERMGSRVTRGRKAARLESGYEFRDALRLSDGRLGFLLEDYRVVTTTSPSGAGGGMTTRTTYYYREGLVLVFRPDGTFDDLFVVPKTQATQDPSAPFTRMNLVEFDGRPAVIYNDNPKNLIRDNDDSTAGTNFRKAAAVIAYTQDGRLVRTPLFATRDADKVLLVPASASRLADGNIVFIASRLRAFSQNQLRFGVIEPANTVRPRQRARR